MICKTVLVAVLVSLAVAQEVSDKKAPVIEKKARVKQHRILGNSAKRDLIKGKEHLRKIKFMWDATEGANAYDVCINCNIKDGKRDHPPSGKVVHATDTCGGQPCYIHDHLKQGETQRYHVRAKFDDGKVTVWSAPKQFTPNEPGWSHHAEL